MKRHTLRLHPEPFDEIATGAKTMELRLYDEKRRHIEVGDELIFVDRRNPENTITTKVIHLVHAQNFHELLANSEVLRKSGPNGQWLEQQLEQFYNQADQRQYGVIGIEFVLVK